MRDGLLVFSDMEPRAAAASSSEVIDFGEGKQHGCFVRQQRFPADTDKPEDNKHCLYVQADEFGIVVARIRRGRYFSVSQQNLRNDSQSQKRSQ